MHLDKKMIAIIAGTAFVSGVIGGATGSFLGNHGRRRGFAQHETRDGSSRFAERGERTDMRKGGAFQEKTSQQEGVSFDTRGDNVSTSSIPQ